MRRMRIAHVNQLPRGEAASTARSFACKWKFTYQYAWLTLFALLFALTSLKVSAAESCAVDTSQANFQLGIPTDVALLSSGDVTLVSALSLDQKNESLTTNAFTFHTYWWFGQTFRAGVSGPLTAADVRIFCNGCSGTPPDITVSVRATSGAEPTGTDLATATIPGFLSPTGSWYRATFANPMNMVAGTTYALIVRANTTLAAGSYAYLISADDTAYSNGQRLTSTTAGNAWDARDRDIGFRIYTGSGYGSAGNLVSALKDSNPGAGGTPTWSTLSWTGATPTGTILRFQAAASDSTSGPFSFVGPDGTANSFFTSTGAGLGQFNGKRYLKYKALLSSTNTSVTPVLNDATVCHDVTTQSADLHITKTDGVSTAAPGGAVTYTIVASNAGPSSVTGATVTDTFPASMQSCSWTCSGANGGSCAAPSGSGNINHGVNLPVGGTATFTANCSIAASATGSLVNTASISSAVSDPTPGNNSATDTDTLTPSANLGITKTNGIGTLMPGSPVTYTIVASNAGPSNVASATITDTFPASLQSCSWTCSGASGGSCAAPSGSGNINHGVSLPVNGTATFTANCTVSSGATGSLVNTASISSGVADPVPGNNSATDTDTVSSSADLSITKTNGQTTSTAGSAVSYTIVASNAGPSGANGVTVNDFFPSALQNCSWTCSGSGGGTCAAAGTGNITQNVNLPAGGSTTFVTNCTLAAGAAGSLTNTATLSSAVPDPVTGNNSATDTDTVVASANLGISKTDGVETLTPGGSVTYTIVASNAGPSMVENATVTDTFPSSLQACSWTCSGSGGGTCPASGAGNISQSVNLPPGGSATFTAGCSVKSNASGSVANTASISSAISDPVPGNNSATDTDSLGASANLGITKTDGVTTAVPGSSVIYTIVATNAGPSNVSAATVTDTFPASLEHCEWVCSGSGGGTCTSAGAGHINQSVGLPVGGSAAFEAICDIKSNATGMLSNTATVSSSVADPVPGNNSATDTDTFGAVADLGVIITDGPGVAIPGGQASFAIVATNTGSSSVSDASVENSLPTGMSCSWTSTTSGGATSTPSGNGQIDDMVDLPVNATATYNVNCTISPNAQGSLVVEASVSSSVPDPTPENNSASDTISLREDLIFKNNFD